MIRTPWATPVVVNRRLTPPNPARPLAMSCAETPSSRATAIAASAFIQLWCPAMGRVAPPAADRPAAEGLDHHVEASPVRPHGDLLGADLGLGIDPIGDEAP